MEETTQRIYDETPEQEIIRAERHLVELSDYMTGLDREQESLDARYKSAQRSIVQMQRIISERKSAIAGDKFLKSHSGEVL